MLTKFDDYPIHQTPEPIAHPASTDRNVYDRYWFNGFTNDGGLYFGIALGLYPHRSVMDCAFSVVVDGVQHSFHGSRRAPAERDDLNIGPFRIEILEPMRRLRIVLDDNATGIACDLEFTARTVAIEEDRQVLKREGKVFMDVTRFTQFGSWQGSIRIGTRTIPVDQIHATRDRSWGIRPVGEPEGGAPARARPQLFFLWAPIHWDDQCTHLAVFEDADGRQLHGEGKIVPADRDGPLARMAGVTHALHYGAGTRWATSGDLTMLAMDGSKVEISLTPIMRFHMKGLGYRHPQWSHGVWKGELEIGGEEWAVADLNPLDIHNIHVQQLVQARMGDRIGYGIAEQLIVGPHAPSGFTGLLDGAR